MAARDDNPVIYLDISAGGGSKLLTGKISEPQLLGRMHFELRTDLRPIASSNFLALVSGVRGVGDDGVPYRYKGTKLYRFVFHLHFSLISLFLESHLISHLLGEIY
jgi:hypothetical protein